MKRTFCTFRKGNSYTHAWIDSKFAKLGLYVQLLTLDSEFWRIIATGATSSEDMSRKHATFKNNI